MQSMQNKTEAPDTGAMANIFDPDAWLQRP
jgi:hypothetical protein